MNAFQPHESFQLLVETGGVERASTLLVAASRAFAGKPRPTAGEIEQFEMLAVRLFPRADPSARGEAAIILGGSAILTPQLEELVVDYVGDALADFLVSAPAISQATMLGLIEQGDVEAASAMARRSDLANVVVAKLFQMNSRRVYRALASNTAIAPRGLFLSALARSAQMDHHIAWSLAAREDFDCALLAPAFFDLQESDRLRVIKAFSNRRTPDAPIRKVIEQMTVRSDELTHALMRLFADNRRPEVTRLLHQVTGLDEVRCGQIAHDVSGAALFVVLRAFRCTAYDGLKVLIHASAHDSDRSRTLADFAALFELVTPQAMAFLMSAWRGEVDLLDLNQPDYLPFTQASRRTPERVGSSRVDLQACKLEYSIVSPK